MPDNDIRLCHNYAMYRPASHTQSCVFSIVWSTRIVINIYTKQPKWSVVGSFHREMWWTCSSWQLRRYVSWEEFHEDMQLIQKNCHQYNPPDSEVRADCDDVFAFYCEELDKAKARSTTEVRARSTPAIIKLQSRSKVFASNKQLINTKLSVSIRDLARLQQPDNTVLENNNDIFCITISTILYSSHCEVKNNNW